MIEGLSTNDIQKLCTLTDELRLRGVHIAHIEVGSLKVELHMNPIGPDELPRSMEVKERMLKDPATTPVQRAKLIAEQDERDLFEDAPKDDEDADQ